MSILDFMLQQTSGANPFREGMTKLAQGILGDGQEAYREEYDATTRSAKGMADARRAQSLALMDAQRQNLSHRLETDTAFQQGLGLDPHQSGLMVLGGGTANQLFDALNKSRELGYRDAAVKAAPGAGYDPVNAQLIGLANGPLQTNEIDEGYQLNPYMTGGSLTPTLGETADIRATNARAGSSEATADAARARAARTRALPLSQPRSGGKSERRKTVRGKTYVERNGQWFEE